MYLKNPKTITCTCPNCKKEFPSEFEGGQTIPDDIATRIVCEECMRNFLKENPPIVKLE